MSGPTRRERFRPLELVGIAAVVAVFVAAVVLLGSRSPTDAVIFGAVGFIVALLLLAMLSLISTSGPPPTDGPVLIPAKPLRRPKPPRDAD